MSDVNFNPATQYVVRNDRTYYSDGAKPDFDKVLSDAIAGYTKIETIKYAAFGARTADGSPDLNSTETKYYSQDGKLMATVTNVGGEDYPHMAISTPTADYHDWDKDGKIDSVDRDRVYDTTPPSQEESPMAKLISELRKPQQNQPNQTQTEVNAASSIINEEKNKVDEIIDKEAKKFNFEA